MYESKFELINAGQLAIICGSEIYFKKTKFYESNCEKLVNKLLL